MSAAPSSLVLLQTCADAAEANALKARLEAARIPSVVQGEHHHALLGGIFGGAIELRLLVPAAALADARALLEATLLEDRPPLHVAGARACAEHGAEASGVCGRCGAFVCPGCEAGTEAAPLCLSCEERLVQRSPATKRRIYGWIAIGILFAGPAAAMVASAAYAVLLGR